ncbi:uncharacterized protein LOC107039393 [Diachasma alloeum]|uniref:uncharacterized protein LOC107039393 n=1 Tax=Diachasma alloeum TaxID=454923 RepID=UPI00073813CB|nr:uncharacterized protein LOC107039393 [Diachasma alloeum]
MNKFVILGLFVASAMAVPMPDNTGNVDCLEMEDSLFSCLAVKANNALSRAARSSDIQLISGITFVRDTPMERSGKSLKTEIEVLNELPRDASDRTMKLFSMLYDSAVSFLKSHSLKINMPEESVSRALTEGRGKIKKVVLPLIAAAGLKILALVPILFGGLGLLVLKALVVGKIALLIAGILAFQKLFGSGASGASGFGASNFFKNLQPSSSYYDNNAGTQGWASGNGQQQQQGYYKRSFDDGKTAQNLAYSAHVPTETD